MGALICAVCGQTTEAEPCGACGASPLLQGRFRLDAVLGRGGRGTTYRATEVATGEVVAIKELPYLSARDLKALELFEREAQVLRQLDHPAIPKCSDVFEHGAGKHRALYIVQELIEGRTLHDELRDHRFTPAEVLEILEELCAILVYLGARSPPIIHRDIKPKNVLRRRSDRRLFLIDFGSVREALRDPDRGGSTVAGTFGYMAPEQFRGEATPRTDLYALGALAIALLSRRDPSELLDLEGRLRWGSALALDPPIEALLRWLLQADPLQRPSSAAELREALVKLRAGAPVHIPGSLSVRDRVQRHNQEAFAREAALAHVGRPAPSPLLVWFQRSLTRRIAGVVGLLALGLAIAHIAVSDVLRGVSGGWIFAGLAAFSVLDGIVKLVTGWDRSATADSERRDA
ncbi:MAG: serine/threonine protein kinase [Deltaproteobacteria bacterium]|nr:serine/threonine protein kinase [Deltaproteobacteria bacterium]